MTENGVVIVVAGGPGLPVAPRLPAHTAVIGADGGAAHALRFGLRLDRVVGDLDSLEHSVAASLEQRGVPIDRHPAGKDETDFELALFAALALRPQRILVVGSATGRLDHVVSQLAVLTSERFAGVQVDALLGEASLHVVRGRRTFGGTPGELISLFAVHGAAHGVTTRGLLYALGAETLSEGVGRGVSNVFVTEQAEISLETGVILAVRPTPSIEPVES